MSISGNSDVVLESVEASIHVAVQDGGHELEDGRREGEVGRNCSMADEAKTHIRAVSARPGIWVIGYWSMRRPSWSGIDCKFPPKALASSATCCCILHL